MTIDNREEIEKIIAYREERGIDDHFNSLAQAIISLDSKTSLLERLMACQLDFSRSLADRVNAVRHTMDALLTALKQGGLISSNLLDKYQATLEADQTWFEARFKALTHFMRNVRKVGYGE